MFTGLDRQYLAVVGHHLDGDHCQHFALRRAYLAGARSAEEQSNVIPATLPVIWRPMEYPVNRTE
jgi:hypothetical protein